MALGHHGPGAAAEDAAIAVPAAAVDAAEPFGGAPAAGGAQWSSDEYSQCSYDPTDLEEEAPSAINWSTVEEAIGIGAARNILKKRSGVHSLAAAHS